MKIAQFLKESHIDYPGKTPASVVFSAECNYHCPACHAKHIIYSDGKVSEQEVFNYLDLRKGWIEGVVLCGGEPTIQPDLAEFARKLKKRGLCVKLDTNGSNPDVLFELQKEKIIDYVALDIKSSPYLYSQVVGKQIDLRDNIEKGMVIVTQFPDYEFRTTIVPVVRGENEISWMTIEEAEDTAKYIVDITGNNEHKYFLQKFDPHKKENVLLDERLREFPETPDKLIKEMLINVRKHLPNTKIRGE